MSISYLKVERLKKKITQSNLSKKLDISQCYLSQIENMNEVPGKDLTIALEDYFDKPIEHLLKKIDI